MRANKNPQGRSKENVDTAKRRREFIAGLCADGKPWIPHLELHYLAMEAGFNCSMASITNDLWMMGIGKAVTYKRENQNKSKIPLALGARRC